MGDEILRSPDRSRLNAPKVREIVRIIGRLPNKDALADVGCFDGSLSVEYLRAGFRRVDGFDVSEAALGRAKDLGINPIVWDFETQPSPAQDGTYDALVCSDVLEHIYNTQNLLRECVRILKSGGTAVFLVPNLTSAYNRVQVLLGRMPIGSPGVSVSHKTEDGVNLGHSRLGTAKEWRGLLENEGFTVDNITGLWGNSLSRAATLSRPSLAHSVIYQCRKTTST
jgi:2-polyprenyl-3-methyl-5-hydroxy-6-metoxy-1,4-benzoquinol methylase